MTKVIILPCSQSWEVEFFSMCTDARGHSPDRCPCRQAEHQIACDLLQMTRDAFGVVAEWPSSGIRHLCVHCDISALMQTDDAKVAEVPVRGFLQTTKSRMSKWEAWLPSPWKWRPMRGGWQDSELEGLREYFKRGRPAPCQQRAAPCPAAFLSDRPAACPNGMARRPGRQVLPGRGASPARRPGSLNGGRHIPPRHIPSLSVPLAQPSVFLRSLCTPGASRPRDVFWLCHYVFS